MTQRKSLDLYFARTAGMLTSARRVTTMLLAVIMLTMTAQTAWAQYPVYLSLDKNDGSGIVDAIPVEYDYFEGNYHYTLSSTYFTRTNHNIVAWNTSPTGDGTSYSVDATIVLDGNLTLYAIWDDFYHTVTFKANGGTGTMNDVTLRLGTEYTIPACAFTRENHQFKGWATTAEGNVAYQPGDKVTVTNDLTLYAVWVKTSCNVTFNANGGTGLMNTVSPALTSEYTIPACGFTKVGYYFIGWATTAEGNVAYQPGDKVTVTNDLTLYAKWTEADGSVTYPYMIYTTEDLINLAEHVNSGTTYEGKLFKLGADITFTHTTDWDNTASTENNFTAIGVTTYSSEKQDWVSHEFKGTFDGDGHTISGIRIYKGGDTKGDQYQGLFVIGSGGTVKNLTLADARITGYKYVGGIVGYNNKGTIENCHVLSNVAIHAVQNGAIKHGGIVGYHAIGGTVRFCTSAATLSLGSGASGYSYGGIAGDSYGSLSDNLAIGVTVPAVDYRGAISCGGGNLQRNYYSNCTVGDTPTASGIGSASDSHPSGADVTENDGAVPLDGYIVTVTGNVTADASNKVYGTSPYYKYNAGATVTLSYRDHPGYVCIGYTVKDADNGDVTVAESSGVYTFTMPAKNVTVSAILIDRDFTHNGHAGTEADPYIIMDAGQLDLLAERVNSGTTYEGMFFKLGADITFTHTTDWDNTASTENNFTAIGVMTYSSYQWWSHQFKGTFDGDGHTISGIRIYKGDNTEGDQFQGLFGWIGSVGTVKNLTLADARITGYTNVGGIVGYNDGTTENCHVLSNVAIHAVKSGANNHGGIVGYHAIEGTVRFCTSAATLSLGSGASGSLYGGIAGISHGSLSDNLAIGVTIPAGNYRGAIAGYYGNLQRNYYSNCTVGSATSGIGYNGADVTENDGAVPATILSESAAVPTPLSGKTAFRRSFTGGKASTVCLPFAYTPGSEGTYYTFSGITKEGGQFVATMNENTATTLLANTPYLFMPTGAKDIVPVLFYGSADYNASSLSTTNGDWTFHGTYSRLEYGTAPFEGNVYGFAATPDDAGVQAGEFVKADTGAGVPPMRCYLTYKDGAAFTGARGVTRGESEEVPETIIVRLIGKNGETEGIGTLTLSTGEFSTDGWYSLDGRRLDGKPTKKGLYINNGRKVVIK